MQCCVFIIACVPDVTISTVSSLSICLRLPRSELIDGTPTLKINHGSGTLVLQLPGNVNVADRRWHRLDVRSNSKVSVHR